MPKLANVAGSTLTLGLLLVSRMLAADTVILDPIPIGSVSGTVGLSGETFGSGQVTSSAANVAYSASIASDGNFSVTTSAESTYSLSVQLSQFQDMPGTSLQQFVYNQPALAENEIRLIDLRRQAGRVSGTVAVTGGVVESISLRASSSNSSVPESFSGSATVTTQPFLAILPMPVVPGATNVSGTVTILSNGGCRVARSLANRTVTVIVGAEVTLQWAADVSAETCSTGTLQGALTTSGLLGQNGDAVETGRNVYVSGPEFRSASLAANDTDYLFENLRTGSYSAGQSVCYRSPYGCYSPNSQGGIQIGAGQITQFSRNLALGTAHGAVEFRGSWGLPELNFAYMVASDNSTLGGSGYDYIDLNSGQFDLVLRSGTSNIYYYYFQDSTYDPTTGDQSNWWTYENRFAGPRIAITLSEGGRVQLDAETIDTSATSLVFQVAQQDGQPEARINRLQVTGNGYVRDSVTGAITASRYISQDDWRSANAVFNVLLRGLPGTYQLQARGYGTDGRQYAAAFEVTLGAPGSTPAGTNVETEFTDDSGEVLGSLTFANVVQGGDTTVSQVTLGPNAPRNFKIYKAGGQPQYFDINTTAVFDGSVEVCLNYDDSNISDPSKEAGLELGHYDDATAAWTVITNPGSPDTVDNIICGTTDSFSIFAILEVDRVDADEDGLEDDNDNCPATANPGQKDFDGDGIGDACDSDTDGDGLPDATDLCPNFVSQNNNDLDGDGIGDPCDGDVDGDAVSNSVDNCPVGSNNDQSDFDFDGAGDQCDVDDDGDSVEDSTDQCPGTELGAVTTSAGCSSPQRFEAACPVGGAYRNHGQYVSCVAREADVQVANGLISSTAKGAIVSAAAQSNIGGTK